MSVLFAVVVLTAVAPGNASAAGTRAETEASVASPHFTGHELDRAVHAALRHWAKPAKNDAEPAAIELLALYQDMSRDTTLAFVTRKHLAGKLRFRLVALRRQAENDSDAGPHSVAVAKVRGILAQDGGGPGPAQDGMSTRRTPPTLIWPI